MSDESIRGMTATEALERIGTGDLSAREYASAFDGLRDELNAFLWAREEAPAPDDGTLSGIPVAVKDIFCTKGVPTTAGSKILEGYSPPYTATAVSRLEAAGAATLAKTNMDEFAMGSSNENSAYGDVLNPWDHAARAGRQLGRLGGGGSRRPRTGCDRHRHRGLDPPAGVALRDRRPQADIRGDLPLRDDRLRVVARPVRPAHATRSPTPRFSCESSKAGTRATRPRRVFPGASSCPRSGDLSGLRFGVATDFSHEAEGVEPDVAQLFQATLSLIEAAGGELVEVELPNAEHGLSAYYVIAPAEASANLARFDGVRYGLRVDGDESTNQQTLGEMYERTRSQGFGAEVKRRIMLGTYALSSGYYDAYYGQAQRVRTKIADDFAGAFGKCDFVVTPTSPTVAFERGARTQDPFAMYLSDYFTVPMSLAGIPAISIPAGLGAASGLPVGFQVAGSRVLGDADFCRRLTGSSPRSASREGRPA